MTYQLGRSAALWSSAAAAAFSLWAAPSAVDAATVSGAVLPATITGTDINATLQVGTGSTPNTGDPRGTVRVTNEPLRFNDMRVGDVSGYFGRAFVTGESTVFELDIAGTSTEPTLQVGRDGTGYLEISGGAFFDLTNTASDASIGDNASGNGTVVVRDQFTLLSIGENLTVGAAGVGSLQVLNGAIVRTEDTSVAGVVIGSAVNSVGDVVVDGQGSLLEVGDDLTVGGSGVGRLTIGQGATVRANNSGNTTIVGGQGRITLGGGTLDVRGISVAGVLEGAGLVRGNGAASGGVFAAPSGRIAVGPGDLLRFNDDVSNQGSVNAEGGEIEFLAAFTNLPASGATPRGRISLEDGRVRFLLGTTNQGVISIAAGASDIHGRVTNAATGEVFVARDAVATFHDAFVNSGSVNVLAGGNLLLLADATFQQAAAISLSVAGGDAPIHVAGTATLGGDLVVALDQAYTPTPGETIPLLLADGGVLSSFHSVTLPAPSGGLSYGLVTSPGGLALAVSLATQSTLEGDYNGDGVVNAADYTSWRDGLGLSHTQADYARWAGNYGAPVGPVAVPEPATLALVFCALIPLARPRGRG